VSKRPDGPYAGSGLGDNRDPERDGAFAPSRMFNPRLAAGMNQAPRVERMTGMNQKRTACGQHQTVPEGRNAPSGLPGLADLAQG